ncbi:uncharacterized protein AB9W97_013540 [Spinachia spinachia]
MSELSSKINPQILLNGMHSEQEQDGAATTEHQMFSVALREEYLEDGDAAENETRAKNQSAFQKVGNQIRSQVGMKSPKSGMLELVQRVKDRETELARVTGDPEGDPADPMTDESKAGMGLKEEDLYAVFEKKLEVRENALKDEFEGKISQVLQEMRAYTDQSLKDLDCKIQSLQSYNLPHRKERQESKGPQKIPGAMATKRGRVLTRTMTTIVPKTCAPFVFGPRAKSETLCSSKGASSVLLLRDPVLCLPVNKPGHGHGRRPPPLVCPPLRQPKTAVQQKAKTGN